MGVMPLDAVGVVGGVSATDFRLVRCQRERSRERDEGMLRLLRRIEPTLSAELELTVMIGPVREAPVGGKGQDASVSRRSSTPSALRSQPKATSTPLLTDASSSSVRLKTRVFSLPTESTTFVETSVSGNGHEGKSDTLAACTVIPTPSQTRPIIQPIDRLLFIVLIG